ncbi:tRNA (N6-threonylcarbamoyladenosine(37)-N6)-methyltransferase TrmO [Solemya pervernicosa gill symbiont]|uniref:tRNA (N6-threonylcarbamoyladenosine(37)-N6)-methyltransferase TrmO n=2 Tax=Gammaproteobacteria incertae sedis TaxID=118884 RepID=A0A1T2L6J9_9GAMM|nr:tRNA (N6-threonylcarbamoyladenosine(37)-N6)-methyltransferase TrmO [Candidatus Reidiella endopervernicosa]OOZ40682.1 tRNA (N6-threonylcarbamoyladenosine(37)-N6)-methyltransferase TrmO [Solemya pervernicosa gill symbiont]QKQ26745.1 tRNA (N6-threonylcarbamoyladenosine(37)-N6)-methyltransferase TrmO [Candidatus Reidiella endopervernicosa]
MVDPVSFNVIGEVHSCFKEKFGTPRQPGLIREAPAKLELHPPYNREEAIRGLDGFSHLWILFLFNQSMMEAWKPMVRPPRLGGNQRVGVFASRSNFRPNPVGLSVVALDSIDLSSGVVLNLSGVDILDGTPVIDIKPYLPYADVIDEAKAGYAPAPPSTAIGIRFSDRALTRCQELESKGCNNLKLIIEQMLLSDPRPGYQRETAQEGKQFGMRLFDLNIKWSVEQGLFVVLEIERVKTG